MIPLRWPETYRHCEEDKPDEAIQEPTLLGKIALYSVRIFL